ncbi:hypothetical protein DSM112329_00886 [Paraconexibacter sp. AEG42_29]|uniref:Mce/MlaD domain-containing protein n=2 Tax=Paraconexibacter sp. AEG42_29 TaxID=2997339 RepID=A0AAU7AR52_9ACTN
MALVGSVGVLGVLVLVYVGFKAPDKIPGRSYYNLKAEFKNADNLTGHYQVRNGGKLVGQVLKPRIENGVAVVDLQLDPTEKGLKSDTRLEVRPRSAVGVRYLDIKPGKNGTPLQEGDTIPFTQTGSTVQLDTVLGTFDTETRANAQKFLRELGTGFAGRGEDLNEAIGGASKMLRLASGAQPGTGAADSLSSTAGWLSAIADRKGSIRSLISGSDTIAGTSDPVREQIAAGFKPQAKALEPFAQERGAIHSTLEKAPGTFTTASSRLPAVDGMVEQLRGFARDIRPGLRAAPASFTQTSALLTESRPGLRDARATLRLADRAVDPTLGLLDTVKPVLPQIDQTLANTTPIVSRLGDFGCDIVQFGTRWGSMLKYGNQGGSYLRFNLNAGPESIYGWSARQGGTSAKFNFSPGPNCQAYNEPKVK